MNVHPCEKLNKEPSDERSVATAPHSELSADQQKTSPPAAFFLLPYSLFPIFAAMQYREIVSVTGLGGLYHLLSTKSDGAIVRSLADNATKFISSRQHNVTPLESIEIYTTGDNVRLHEVLQKMQESATARPDAKAGPDAIRAYFAEVYPDMDEDRVYTSDMKKMLKWFDILKGADLLDFSAMNAAPTDEATAPSAEGEAQIAEHAKGGDVEVPLVEEGEEKPALSVAEAPAKKARAKKAAASEEEGEEKPVLSGAEAPAKKTAAKKAAKPKKDAEGE